MAIPRVKNCETCGELFWRKSRDSNRQWAERAFCSAACSNDAKKDVPPHIVFWASTEVSSDNACWLWCGTKDERGYGRIHFRTLKFKAHRVAFEMRHGPIAEGLVVCHICDNPSCVNPNHLYAGTHKDNARDMVARKRQNPKSLKNLRPGAAGRLGAGPKSNQEIEDGR